MWPTGSCVYMLKSNKKNLKKKNTVYLLSLPGFTNTAHDGGVDGEKLVAWMDCGVQ